VGVGEIPRGARPSLLLADLGLPLPIPSLNTGPADTLKRGTLDPADADAAAVAKSVISSSVVQSCLQALQRGGMLRHIFQIAQDQQGKQGKTMIKAPAKHGLVTSLIILDADCDVNNSSEVAASLLVVPTLVSTGLKPSCSNRSSPRSLPHCVPVAHSLWP